MTLNEQANGPCCAHLCVSYLASVTNGITRGWWECDNCDMHFAPVPFGFGVFPASDGIAQGTQGIAHKSDASSSSNQENNDSEIAGALQNLFDHNGSLRDPVWRAWIEVAIKRLSVETTTRQPDGYAYRRHSPYNPGETYISFNGPGVQNGLEPIEAVPYWVGHAPPTVFPKSVTDCDHANAIFKCAGCGIDLVGENRGHPERNAVEPTEK